MKSVLFAAVLGLSSFASAAAPAITQACTDLAVKSVMSVVEPGKYDADGFNAEDCFSSSEQNAVLCFVSATKGNGDATDTYQTVMNAGCSKTLRVELKYEE